MGMNNPMKIKYISYRVEFQGRGAAHIHGTLWLNIKEIELSPKFHADDIRPGTLSGAFRKFRDDVKLTETEKKAIAKFTDMFVTCSLNPNTVHDDPKVKEDTEPHRYFLSELIFYMGFTDERDLGCDDEQKCRK